MPDRNDVIFAKENGGLAIGYRVILKGGRCCNDEQLIPINFDLGLLMGLESILDGERVEIKALLKQPEFVLAWLMKADPNKLILGE